MLYKLAKTAQRYVNEIDPRDLAIIEKNYLTHLAVTLDQKLFRYWSPTATGTEITYLCGRRCLGCYLPNDIKKGEEVMSEDNLEIIVERGINNHVIFTGLIGGEPIQEATIPLITSVIKKHPLRSFFAYTNGDYIAEKGLGELETLHNLSYCVSLDGIESHNKIRGKGSFENVLATFDRLKEAKKIYSASVTLRRETIDELTSPEFFELMVDKGVKYIHFMKFKSDDLDNLSEEEYTNAIIKIKQNSKDQPILTIFGGVEDGRSLSKLFSYKEMFINLQGDVRVSKTDADENFGNLIHQSFEDVLRTIRIEKGV